MIALPMFLGGIALSVDTIQWSLAKRQMQRQADSAAIAGAFGLAQGANVVESATADLALNSFAALTKAPVIENAPTQGGFIADPAAVRVVLGTRMRLPFSSLFIDGMDIGAEATAKVVGQGEYCVVALDTRAVTGVSMKGNTTLDIGCGIISNTMATDSVSATGSSSVKASPIAAVGGVQKSRNFEEPVEFFPYAVPQRDPFADLPDPTGIGSGSVLSVKSKASIDISPGTYRSVDIKGTVNMAPGVYYINGGNFSVGAQGIVRGIGVAIVLTSNTAEGNPSSIATMDMNGGAQIELTAPTSGPYAGVMIYQDRRALDNKSNKINGNSSSKFQGALYFPSQAMAFSGNTGMQSACLQLVAKRVEFTGNSKITNVCPDGSGAGAIPGSVIRLVG